MQIYSDRKKIGGRARKLLGMMNQFATLIVMTISQMCM